MKIWLDDRHVNFPDDYIWIKSPELLVQMLQTEDVTHVSLDHDLGFAHCEGYSVLAWIEKRVVQNKDYLPPIIYIHTANPPARKRMVQAVESIWKLVYERETRRNGI